jgi:hypothetical protein
LIPVFDRFVGVDWSGASGRQYSGIAVAECHVGTGAPMLVEPPGKRWRRTDFVTWLAAHAGRGERLLVGIDCAFALPARMAGALLGKDYSVPALWAYVDAYCAEAEDFFGGLFALHDLHSPHFWHSGPRPAGFAELHRATEYACRAAGLGAPESPLKLVGARQVGKGGLAGMRVLHALKTRLGARFAVWPFDPPDGADIVCIELYPRLFMKMAGHGNGKVRTSDALARCLGALGCTDALSCPASEIASPLEGEVGAKRRVGGMSPPSPSQSTSGSSTPHPAAKAPPTSPSRGEALSKEASAEKLVDHETDALVAAAGLRFIAGDPAVWQPKGLDALAMRAEGWIFGVT